ncbi:MAG: ribonuclease P protein component [bacterium]|nr:ribonuclease P protein component [bacterium]MDE0352876.1 ribonuclease P protein component [bacterium]
MTTAPSTASAASAGSSSPESRGGIRRLSGTVEFNAVLRHGRRVRRGGITVVARRRDGGLPRIGLVVGRRVGGAVVRNRAKRRLRAALREVTLAEATDYVLIATPAVATAPFQELRKWIRDAVSSTLPRARAR